MNFTRAVKVTGQYLIITLPINSALITYFDIQIFMKEQKGRSPFTLCMRAIAF